MPRFIREHPAASVLLFCLFLGLGLVIRNLVKSAHVSRDPALMAIRQAGYPVTLEELNAFYPAVPDEQNAALLYQEAFQSVSFTNPLLNGITRDLEPTRCEPLPGEVCALLTAVFATNGYPWRLLHEATNLTHSRFPLDFREGHMVLLPHLAKIKGGVQNLCWEALVRASEGDSNRAYAAFNAAFHLGDSIRDEPILISYLVRVASSAIVARRLELALNLVPFSEESLRSMQARFAAAGDPRWPARALAGERAFGLSFFIDRHIQNMATRPQQGIGFPTGVGGQLFFSGYRAIGLMGKDLRQYVSTMGNCVARAELPPEERGRLGPLPSMVVTNRFLIFSRMMLPALQNVLDRADENAARMRVVEAALGVERFRMANSGALPRDLAQLTPTYLRSVPADPFDAQPIRYKKTSRGYAVYSIGPDKNDDGGAEPVPSSQKRSGGKPTPKDLTFVVERK